MLTERDVTIPDAVEVYQTLDGTGLRHVAVKDVGADRGMLADLTAAVHEADQLLLLEVADVTEAGQEAGVALALTLGADIIVATWRPESAAAIGSVARPAYFPFLGSLSGSPLQLRTSPDQLRAQAAELAEHAEVAGMVLMPYRQRQHRPDDLMAGVTGATARPVLIAGGVASDGQISAVARAGAWGFTMGAEALKHRHEDRWSVRHKVIETLNLCQSLAPAPAEYETRVVR